MKTIWVHGFCFLSLLIIPTPLFSNPSMNTSLETQQAPFELGGSYQLIFPSQTPELSGQISTIGAFASMPVTENQDLVMDLGYGSLLEQSHFLASLGYRVSLPTPFFRGYILGGIHGHYFNSNQFRTGVNLGFGMLVRAIDAVNVQLGMKFFVQKSVMGSFGLAISYRL